MMKRMRRRGFSLIELMVVVAIIGILAAIAIPNFVRFQARAKQGEVKSNLKSLFTAQRSYFQEYDAYVVEIRTLGFSPERGNRYYYQMGANAEDRSKSPAGTAAANDAVTVDTFKFSTAQSQPVYKGDIATWTDGTKAQPPQVAPGGVVAIVGCPTCEFSMMATGNVDTDPVGLDSWYIASLDSTNVPHAGVQENVPAGEPQNTYNDVNSDD